MPAFPNSIVPLLGLALLLGIPASAGATSISENVRLRIGEFGGSTGQTTLSILRADLEDSGQILFIDPGSPPGQPDGGDFTLEGTSAAGVISAKLRNPDGDVVLDRSYSAAEIALNAHLLADDILGVTTGKVGIASSTIAFVSQASGLPQIHTCAYDGGMDQQITHDSSPCVAPALHPDGNSIAFTGYSLGHDDTNSLDLITGERIQVVQAPGTSGGTAISPDGKLVALTMSYSGNVELYIASMDGGKPIQLTASSGIESSPSWAPDGQHLVYSYQENTRSSLRIIAVDGSPVGVLDTREEATADPDWSPDGKFVAYTALAASSGSTAIHLHSLEDGTTRILAEDGARSPSWAPSGDRVAFCRGRQLCVFKLPEGRETTLLRHTAPITETDWSR